MPNHVTNRIKIIGDTHNVELIKQEISGIDTAIDFNKIIPMPEGLEVEISMNIEYMVKNALKISNRSDGLLAALEAANMEKTKSPLELDNKEWEQFLQCLNNYRSTGCIYWYDWANKNWGTKWNAYGQPHKNTKDNEVWFETAWSGAKLVIQELSNKYPDAKIELTYADEDTGSNCARIMYSKGSVIDSYVPDSQSKEAYELYFELNPEDRKNYNLIGGEYQYIDQD